MKKIALFLSLFLVATMVFTSVITVNDNGDTISLKGPDLKPTRDGDPEEGVFLF